jgi:septal ring factor EnvC (AmiA/AmiB activator)
MKKLLVIVVLGLLLSTPAYSFCIWNCASKQDVDSARDELGSLKQEIDEIRSETEKARREAREAREELEDAELERDACIIGIDIAC